MEPNGGKRGKEGTEAEPPHSVAPHSKLSFLNLPPFTPLINVQRSRCQKCDKYQRFVCYQCMSFMHSDPALPHLQLPIELHICHHASETISKSTAAHAAIVAPSSTTFHEYPELPCFDANDTLLVYPHPDAVTLAGIADLSRFKRVVFVDSAWRKSQVILKHSTFRNLTRVRLDDYNTLFWRHQTVGPTCLATIEAIYYFFREYAKARHGGTYRGQFDSLMYLFTFQYELIQNKYHGRAMPRLPNFVRATGQEDSKHQNENI